MKLGTTARRFSAIVLMAVLLAAMVFTAVACGGGIKAQDGDTVRVLYNGTYDSGEVFDSSEMQGGEPLEFTIGSGLVVPGFNDAVIGMSVNQTVKVRIPPEEAYGPLYFVEERDLFPADVEVGEWFTTTTAEGQTFSAVVVNISETHVTLENKHAMAGQNLNFEITLVEIVQ